MGYREDEKRWKRIQDMLAAEAGGKELRPTVSQRTLFGIPSTMEQTIDRIVAEDEASRRAKRLGENAGDAAQPAGTEGPAAPAPAPGEMAGETGGEGLSLVRDEEGLALTDGTMSVRGDFSRMKHRIKPQVLVRELVVKAARIKGQREGLKLVDATAGLGEDSLLLAAAGFDVTLYERNEVIAELLQDAISRAAQDPDLAQAASRMHLVVGDSTESLPHLDFAPDVVLLDPMFPDRQKSAAVKKKLQLLQRLERPCDDEAALLDAAFTAKPRKVIVKRPAKGPHLAGRKPDYSLSGKAIRFDCYSIAR